MWVETNLILYHIFSTSDSGYQHCCCCCWNHHGQGQVNTSSSSSDSNSVDMWNTSNIGHCDGIHNEAVHQYQYQHHHYTHRIHQEATLSSQSLSKEVWREVVFSSMARLYLLLTDSLLMMLTSPHPSTQTSVSGDAGGKEFLGVYSLAAAVSMLIEACDNSNNNRNNSSYSNKKSCNSSSSKDTIVSVGSDRRRERRRGGGGGGGWQFEAIALTAMWVRLRVEETKTKTMAMVNTKINTKIKSDSAASIDFLSPGTTSNIIYVLIYVYLWNYKLYSYFNPHYLLLLVSELF